MAEPRDDTKFWCFSLDRYGRPGVDRLCIAFQDAVGADVNLLLLCLWCGQRGISLSAGDIASLTSGDAADWHRAIVKPLRAARRAMKTPPAGFDAAETEELRTRLKEIEIEAERLEQAALERTVAPLADGTDGSTGLDVETRRSRAIANAVSYVESLESGASLRFAGELGELVRLTVDGPVRA